MVYRNKTYICFDADTDMWAYKFMVGWKNNDNIDFNFYNAHDLNSLREGSKEETIKPKLRERLKAAKIFIVLIGENTKRLYKFVRWEMDIALEMDIPIIAVNLNKSKEIDLELCPPVIRDRLVLHIPYKQVAIKWAIDNWIEGRNYQRKHNDTGPCRLKDSLYEELGIY